MPIVTSSNEERDTVRKSMSCSLFERLVADGDAQGIAWHSHGEKRRIVVQRILRVMRAMTATIPRRRRRGASAHEQGQGPQHCQMANHWLSLGGWRWCVQFWGLAPSARGSAPSARALRVRHNRRATANPAAPRLVGSRTDRINSLDGQDTQEKTELHNSPTTTKQKPILFILYILFFLAGRHKPILARPCRLSAVGCQR